MPLLAGILLITKRIRWDAINFWLIFVISWFGAMLLGSHSILSAVQFSACLSTLFMISLVDDKLLLNRISNLTLVLILLNIILIFSYFLGITPDIIFDNVWVLGDSGEYRYRFVFAEPNNMNFFVFFCALISWEVTSNRHWAVQCLIAFGLIASGIMSGSPLAIFGIIGYFLLYLKNASYGIKSITAIGSSVIIVLLFALLPEMLMIRLSSIFDGTDNSANLRTWGSVLIAYYTLEDAGSLIFGGGIGSARMALFGNVYMGTFAAAHESILPSFIGTMFVEGGYYSLIGLMVIIVGMIYLSKSSLSATLSAILLIGQLLSSSFFYDTISWAAIGVIFNCYWQRALRTGVARE
jgi:hypothetical protein